MYCRNCGSIVDKDMAFCDACGAKLKIDGVQQPNAISDSHVSNPTGIKGQTAQAKYLVLGWIVTAIVLLGIILKLARVY